jgi:hypothetical protein
VAVPYGSLDGDEADRIYGPWRPRTPVDVAELFAGYEGRWWIAGGWAIEAFSGVKRDHGDIDPSIPRSDLPLLRRHLAGRIDLWAADQETLRVLLPEDIGEDDDLLPDSCEAVRARNSGGDPWEYDITLMTTVGDRWIFKRDARTTLLLDEIVWAQDGISYLRPEIQLLHKAAGLRPKDQADFDAAWPVLDPKSRQWLRDAIRRTHPGHPWLSAM